MLSREFQRSCTWSKSNPIYSLLGTRKVKYLDGLPSHRRPHARGFLRENRRFSRDSLAATQFEGKKHCASFVVSSGTCSPPPRQQLINRSAFSQETRETHRAASFLVNGVSYWLVFVYCYKKQTVLTNTAFLITPPSPVVRFYRAGWFLKRRKFCFVYPCHLSIVSF